MRQVLGWGNRAARYVLIGEAPGEHEEEQGEPFVGASGWRLREWWGKAGLRREDFYIDNVCQYRPPHNSIEAFDTAYLQSWMSHLHERLATLTDPFVLIPCGNYALYALTGKGKVKWHTHDGKQTRAGITDWRGSILSYTTLDGRVIKVVPTVHPAATFRQPDLEGVCIRDWQKIAHEGTFKGLDLPRRQHDIKPTFDRVVHYFASLPREAVVAVDIENPQPKEVVNANVPAPIVCVGFADQPDRSFTVPTTESYWGSQSTLERVWKLVAGVLGRQDCAFIFHNGLYDTFHLQWEHAIHVSNYRYDTLYMHHCLDPSDWHALDYCASRDTRQPFWKHEAKDPEEAAKYANNLEAFWTYNGIDACVTRELYDVYHQRLSEQGRLDFYLKHYAALLEPLQSLQLHGLRVDDAKRRYRQAHLLADCIDLQDQLEASTGLKLYGKSSLSNTKLKHYLYEILGLPKQERARKVRGGDKTVSSDELAVRKLTVKYPNVLGRLIDPPPPVDQMGVGQLILTHKYKAKLREFYDEGRVDLDGRIRASYSMNTEAGRLSSSSNPNGTGSNLQNQSRDIRDMFLPDAGMVGVEVDLSAAEARINYIITYMLTGNKDLYDKAHLRPDEYDQHVENASFIFNVPTAEVTDLQRQLGKSTVHGSWRDMQGQKLSDGLLKEGHTYTPAECQAFINAYKKRMSGIDEYFRWCRRQAIEHRYVENSWGRRLYFTYDRFGDEVYRRVYSYYPQSEIGDWMNQLGLIPFFWYIEQESRREGQRIANINVHAHDALFFSVLPQYAYDTTKFLVDSLEQTRTLYGTSLAIPTESKLGTNWKGRFKHKRLPSRDDFNDQIAQLGPL